MSGADAGFRRDQKGMLYWGQELFNQTRGEDSRASGDGQYTKGNPHHVLREGESAPACVAGVLTRVGMGPRTEQRGEGNCSRNEHLCKEEQQPYFPTLHLPREKGIIATHSSTHYKLPESSRSLNWGW